MSEKSWEQQAVEEILALEELRDKLLRELADKNELFAIADALHLNTTKIQQQGEEIEADLHDAMIALGECD